MKEQNKATGGESIPSQGVGKSLETQVVFCGFCVGFVGKKVNKKAGETGGGGRGESFVRSLDSDNRRP